MGARVRLWRWALVVLALLLSVAPSRAAAAAERHARLTVERPKNARACPDGAKIAARINAMTGRDAIREDAELGIVVSIERASPGFRAVLTVEGPRKGTRELIDDTSSCSALGEAIAITVALLLDEEVDNKPPIRVTRVEKQPPPPVPEEEPSAPPPKASRLPSWMLDILVAQTAGFISSANFAVLAEVNVLLGEHATVGVFGMGILPEDISLPRGELRMNLVFAGFPVCYTLRTDDTSLGVAFCGFPAVGGMIAEGQGLDVDETATLPWFALGGSVVADGPIVGPLSFSGRVSLMAPLTRASFQVRDLGQAPANEVGVVFEGPPLGVAFAYGVRAMIP